MFLFQPFFVQGDSMKPNFEDGQYLIINELGYKETPIGIGNNTLFTVKPYKELDRQKIVVFRYPKDPSKFFIKRVIGLPKEKIEVKNGEVKIYNDANPNGYVLDESAYLGKTVRTEGDLMINLKDEEYFVMGDNRAYSSDSRMWGPVKTKFIMGEVLFRAWPADKIGVF
jgi:signal peptidase I